MVTAIYYFFESGQYCKIDDENLGCIGFTKQRTVDSVNLEDTNGSGDKILPHQVKDVSVYLKQIYYFPSAIRICCRTEIKIIFKQY